MYSPTRMHWGVNISRRSPWHRTDPRVRLFTSLAFSGLALISTSLPEFLCLYFFLWVLYFSSFTAWKVAWQGFRPFFVLLAFTVVLQLLLTPGDPVRVAGGAVPGITVQGTLLSCLILARLSAVILVSAHLVNTTSPLELSRSFGWALAPLGRAGLPVADLVLILNLGFQFFPIILDESRSLRLALESRGISVRHQSTSFRFRALAAWILAVLTSVVERSQRLATALEVKNFTGGCRLRLRFPSWSTQSTMAFALTFFAIAAWCLARFAFPDATTLSPGKLPVG